MRIQIYEDEFKKVYLQSDHFDLVMDYTIGGRVTTLLNKDVNAEYLAEMYKIPLPIRKEGMI